MTDAKNDAAPVVDNPTLKRFELTVNGETAFLVYDRAPGVLTFIHTEVPLDLRGHHVGETLVKAALDAARSEGLRIVAVCPFVRDYLRKHPRTS
jgi:predicted GNAT family acetyltransferase